ncbi:MAG: cupin domain-containing protein [Alphaproteobacteria bacterium]
MSSKQPIFVPAGAGEQLKILGSVHTNKVTPDKTGGAFIALEITVPPRCGPPMHTHEKDCEFFYVLEGELTFSHPGGSVVAKPGDFCFLPTGGYHAFRNDGEKDAKALVVVAPGIAAHKFFDEVDHRLHGAIDEPVVADVAGRNGISFGAPAN